MRRQRGVIRWLTIMLFAVMGIVFVIPATANASPLDEQPKAATPQSDMTLPDLSAQQKTWAETQLRLAALGLYSGKIDAIWGPKSQTAMRRRQALHRLPQTGQIDPQQYKRLRSETLTGYTFEVSISHQTITFYRNGRQFYTDHVSTGAAATPTPIDSGAVFRQVQGWHQSKLGWLYYPTFFLPRNPGIALHGSTSVPHYPASHGCVRVELPLSYAQFRVLQIGMAGSVARER